MNKTALRCCSLPYPGKSTNRGLRLTKKLWCEKHPGFYFLSVWHKRIRRYINWLGGNYCSVRNPSKLPFRVKSHKSLLVRRLGDSDLQLQYNKITNLKLALTAMDGIIIRPGEAFSFWKIVGLPTRRKGYIEGMLLSRGEVMKGVGGGLCQLANLLHWIILHSPLAVIERYHHGFDPFPDDGRVLPFGTGAAIFYNYIDYQFLNDTAVTFQLKVWLTDKHIRGELRSSEDVPYSYHVFEVNHGFLKQDDRIYRHNEIWRRVVDKRTGNTVAKQKIHTNFAEVKYDLGDR